ncbi:hypothetical protein TNCV_600831 [Trichonephila clavipes]|nr:hypothetical protein TNCV_600831 [Trichonephila clavipes]
MIHYRERKLLNGSDVSENAEKVSTASFVDVCRVPTPLRTSKSFLRRVSQHTVHRMLNEDQSADEVKNVLQSELQNMAKNGFQKCFDDLYKPLQKCIVTQGSYFYGGCVSVT